MYIILNNVFLLNSVSFPFEVVLYLLPKSLVFIDQRSKKHSDHFCKLQNVQTIYTLQFSSANETNFKQTMCYKPLCKYNKPPSEDPVSRCLNPAGKFSIISIGSAIMWLQLASAREKGNYEMNQNNLQKRGGRGGEKKKKVHFSIS